MNHPFNSLGIVSDWSGRLEEPARVEMEINPDGNIGCTHVNQAVHVPS